jgi:ribosome-associated protein
VKAIATHNDQARDYGQFPKQLSDLAVRSLDDDKAEDIVVIDLAGKSSIADFMIIATGRSQRQVAALAEHVREKLAALGVKRVSTEGLSQADWVLIDAGDVIVHLFRPEVRAFYNLEKMWGVSLGDPALAETVTRVPTALRSGAPA